MANNNPHTVVASNVVLQELTDRQRCFAETYVRTCNLGLAFREAYKPAPHVSARSILADAKAMLLLPHVAAKIESLRLDAFAATNIQLRELLVNWYEIATADPHELMQYRRVNCRYCRGVDHKYQWKQGELWEAQSAAMVADRPMPDEAGGVGYLRNLEPVSDCPECEGEGIVDVHFADTTKLEGKARKLFKGVKVTRNGTEIMVHDQHVAAETLAKILGAFPEIGKPVESTTTKTDAIAAATPQEAGKAYLRLIRGDK